jgi:hypothetical protein
MLTSGSSPLTVMRDSMWGFLMFAGAAWLAIGWSVLRLEPTDVVTVAGPVILFAALCEAVRALAGAKTWWLNASMTVLFAATGVVLLTVQESTFTTPSSLIGWYLMVRGAVDVAVSMMNRGVDRTWGLVMTLGVLQAGLGFFAASPASRTADLVIVTLGGVGLLRGIADLVTALRLREVSAARHDILHLPPEREAGVAGYSAGLSDFETAPAKPRHRATPAPTTHPVTETQPAADTEPAAETHVAEPVAGVEASPADTVADLAATARNFHDEVVRTTADLDTMIAQAGVTGTGTATHRVPPHLPTVPDTAESVAARESVPARHDSAASLEDERTK